MAQRPWPEEEGDVTMRHTRSLARAGQDEEEGLLRAWVTRAWQGKEATAKAEA